MGGIRDKILLVEENELDQIAFKRFVEQGFLPYDCTIAASVTEARSYLSERRFDVIISDYGFKDGTGFDILDSVGDTPAVFLIDAGDQETAIRAWRKGACACLIKDIDLDYLKAVPVVIENAVRSAKTKAKVRLLCRAVISADESIYIADMQGRIIFVNRAFCETYGYTEDEIVGKPTAALWRDAVRGAIIESTWKKRSADRAGRAGFHHKRKDHSIFPISLSRSYIRDSKGNEVAVVAIVRDISDRILVEDELRAANRELSKRIKRNSELAIVALEELRTALAGVQIDRAKIIADDFLTIAEIDAGRMELELTEFDFVALIRRAVQRLSSYATEKGVMLTDSLPDVELPVKADFRRLGRALGSLIEWSISSVRPGSCVTVWVEDTDNQIAVRIEDNGAVIDSGRMQNIFDRSGWTKEWLADEYGDLTLALGIAKEVVEMHGGCLWTETGDERENVVRFTLPKSHILQEVSVGAVS